MPRGRLLILIGLILVALNGCAPSSEPQAQATVRPPVSPLVVDHPSPTPSPTPEPTPTPAPTLAPSMITTAMPVYRQVMNLDCETAALQMGLAALGHYYTQAALFAPQNPDNTLPVMASRYRVLKWGNPYTNFVGKVDGSDLGPTGYGVYWPPILAIARSHGAPNSIGKEGFSAAEIYHAVANHHPVLVWVETGWENATAAGYRGIWTAWDGNKIPYSLIEHVVTLSGVSPTQVRVNDPWKAGSQYWYSKAAFEASWRDFNDMAVILQ